MKKRMLLWIVLLLACLLPVWAEGSGGKIVRITHNKTVNVRTGPGTGYKMLGEVKPGSTFDYLGTKDGWNCIQYTAGKKGYVSGKLSAVEEAPVKKSEGSLKGLLKSEDEAVVRITHNRTVNVRNAPGTDSKVLCEVKPGSAYPYMGTSGNWHRIEYKDGKYGYVSAKLTEVENGGNDDIVSGATVYADDTPDDAAAKNKSKGGSSEGKRCPRCNGLRNCLYCVGGRIYQGGGKWGTCTFCWGSLICSMCGGLGYLY